MEVKPIPKPIPKPRSIMTDNQPIPAPRKMKTAPPLQPVSPLSSASSSSSPSTSPPTLSAVLQTTRSSSPTESSYSERSDSSKSIHESRNSTNANEFFRQLSTSSRQLKEDISEKMSVKGRAVISSTRNASIRLEKSVKNLLARRLTSLNQEELDRESNSRTTDPLESERCVSLPPNDIFSSISFHSPFGGNLRSMKNEEDLSGNRHSPPPPVYPPPPLPDESIYDELQSVAGSGSSGRYETLSSTSSEKPVDRDFPDAASSFDLLDFARNQSDSDQSLNLSDVNLSAFGDGKSCDSRSRLSRSDSWTFYDTAASNRSSDRVNGLDRISSAEEDTLDVQSSILDRSLTDTDDSRSLRNSIYENCSPRKIEDDYKMNENENDEAPVEQQLRTSSPERLKNSRSLLFEFDPFARRSEDESVYSNYENNDLMLLEALLATNDSPDSNGSTVDLQEVELEEEHEASRRDALDEDVEEFDLDHDQRHGDGTASSRTPPEPPKRFDSLPKNEYDEVEPMEKLAPPKNPPLLPKLAHLAMRKQPAVPPRKPSIKSQAKEPSPPVAPKPSMSNALPVVSVPTNVEESSSSSTPKSSGGEEHRRTSVIQKLMKLGQDSSAHVRRPNVISFVKSGGKLLSRNKDHANAAPPDANPNVSTKMERPKSLSAHHMPATHRGIVYRVGVGIERAKDLVQRAAVLEDRKLSFYTDKSMSTLKEVISLDTVYSIHLLQDVKVIDGETVHCIAINGEGRPAVHVFYAKGIAERRVWAQRILEAMTPVFPTRYTAELTRAGWAYLKEGVTGTWFPAWVLLQQRDLIYTRTLDPVTFERIDLRKARCIVVLREEGPIPKGKHVPVVAVDAGGTGALHISAPGSRECPTWEYALHQSAVTCGPALDQQQLTQDDVPVIVDKCINFIYAHGIMSEGIYRRSGSSSAVTRLLEAFRRDAMETQITRGSYSEHDVATVLRRFLRDLPDPLFPASIHDRLCRTSEARNESERVESYRKLLSEMPVVVAATIRRILAHLHCLSQQSVRNLMTVENLSAIWGPTLMHVGKTGSAEEWNKSETKVIGDLIRLYPRLYRLSSAELAKEAKMLEILKRHHVSNNSLRCAPSGDLKIWIYIFSRDGECVNVTIGPQKTAFDVCRELADKAGLPAHELCLEERTLSGALERPVHYGERVLETVVRWGYWEPEDRKDNVLILRKDYLYKDIILLVKPPMTVSGELKFADTKSKSFKTHLFEFSQAKLCYYKDKVCSVKLDEWKIEDIIWYLGHEPKRNPQTGWSITFIAKNKKPQRCKESPFFGNTIAGASKDEQYRWMAAMLFGEYQLSLRPSAVNLMDL